MGVFHMNWRQHLLILASVPLLALSGCASQPRPTEGGFANIGYADWTDMEPAYRLYPGDTLDISAASAPELNRTVTVQPDGRISLPLVAPVMVADRTAQEAQLAVSSAYGAVLVHPDVEVTIHSATPLKVFVGGEVDKPGVYDMPGDINALQAVLMAGGLRISANADRVVILRRGPDGSAMMRTLDLSRAMRDPVHTDAIPLRRFDIIFVPRSGISKAGLFMQQYIRDLVPVQFSYAVNQKTYLTTR